MATDQDANDHDERNDRLARGELLRDLHLDLVDGKDLALAVELIGDALGRRVRRLRLGVARLDTLDQTADLQARIRDLAFQAEKRLRGLTDELAEGARSFQEALEDVAVDLEEGEELAPLPDDL